VLPRVKYDTKSAISIKPEVARQYSWLCTTIWLNLSLVYLHNLQRQDIQTLTTASWALLIVNTLTGRFAIAEQVLSSI